MPAPTLTADEQRFLDHEVDELCAMVTDWETTNVHRDLPPAVWQFIKDKGFLGMIIPKEYGGLGFSAYAHSQVDDQAVDAFGDRRRSRSWCPNSLGPGELLVHYGTEEQKRHYLPRLAKGVEIPCFALTNPNAGSDAAAIPDVGIVCWGEHEGQRVLGIRLTWEKRYITLGPVATLLGLAFRAYDPDHLVGDKDDIGITCALMPDLASRRRDRPPAHAAQRGVPERTRLRQGRLHPDGLDHRRPADAGARLADADGMPGRGPRRSRCRRRRPAMAKLAVRATGGYARVRTQFKTPIGRFEGIEEALARMGGNLYMMDATRRAHDRRRSTPARSPR